MEVVVFVSDLKIKTKQQNKEKIKTLNKAIIGTQKIKNRVITTKDKINNMTNADEEKENSNEYAINKISSNMQKIPYKFQKFNEYGKENFEITKNNIYQLNQKLKNDKKKIYAQKNIENKEKVKIIENENLKNITKKEVKTINETRNRTTNKVIKTSENTGKNIKLAKGKEKVDVNEIKNNSKKVFQVIKQKTEKTTTDIKSIFESTISSVKAIINGNKVLMSFGIAIAWVFAIIVIVICLIAMLCSSFMGIFFSSENVGSMITINGEKQPITMNKLVSNLNIEFMNEINKILLENPHEEYDITGNRAEWKEILAVYTAKVSNGNNETEVMMLDDNKASILREIFFQMNEINFTKEITYERQEVIENKKVKYITITHTKLHITITGKNTEEMSNRYRFNQKQKEQLQELLKDEYSKLWLAVIYGTSNGSSNIVEVARRQIGNIRRRTLLELVWIYFKSRMVCSVRVILCK